jgi:ATP-dependent protease ClpP protease subunit
MNIINIIKMKKGNFFEHKFNWPSDSNRRNKKRKLDDDDDYEYRDDLFVSNDVRSVGNKIYFNCSVRNSTISKLTRIIEQKNYEYKMIISHELIGRADPAPIYLHINSGGGDLMAAMSAVDAMKRSIVPIYTVVDGKAASAASLMSVCGVKRYITRHSYMLIHQLSSGVVGKYQDIEDEYDNCNLMMDDIVEIYKEGSSLTEKKIKKFLKRDKWWKAGLCMEYGLVDDYIENADPAPLDLVGLLTAAAAHGAE